MVSYIFYINEENPNPIIKFEDNKLLERYEITFSYTSSIEVVCMIYKDSEIEAKYFSKCAHCWHEGNCTKHLSAQNTYDTLKKENFFKDSNIHSIELSGHLEKAEQSNSSDKKTFNKMYLRTYGIKVSKIDMNENKFLKS